MAHASGISDGVYLVGADIPAGRYKGDAVGGRGYWQISTDPNGSNIVQNDTPTGQFYIEVAKGQYLKLSGVEITPAKAAVPTIALGSRSGISDGVYLVGADIPAGRYKGDAVGGRGYWQISTDPNGSNIVQNDTPTGQFYIEVAKGQYLKLSGVEITPAKAAVPTIALGSRSGISDGVYLVGADIPAGRYKGDAVGGRGYWQISTDPNGSNVVENDIPTGQFYIEATSGQYLKLSGVVIRKAD